MSQGAEKAAVKLGVSRRMFWVGCAAIPLAAALTELAMGRRVISASGKIMLWAGTVKSAENSQQLADWYSITHVLHGILIYGVVRLIVRRPLPGRVFFVITLMTESAWEVLENSPFIINRYRAGTAALGYMGDTVLNSMSDIACCMVGFLLARWLPAWVTILLFVAIEITLALAIRDNLTLNILMLIRPIEAIKRWQLGA